MLRHARATPSSAGCHCPRRRALRPPRAGCLWGTAACRCKSLPRYLFLHNWHVSRAQKWTGIAEWRAFTGGVPVCHISATALHGSRFGCARFAESPQSNCSRLIGQACGCRGDWTGFCVPVNTDLLLMRCRMRIFDTAGAPALPDAGAAGSRACIVMRDATVVMFTEDVPAGAASDALRVCSSA